MKTYIICLVGSLLISSILVGQNVDTAFVESKLVDSKRIKPYKSNWNYVKLEDSKEILIGEFSEDLSITDSEGFRILERKKTRKYRQNIRGMKEGTYSETLIFDMSTLEPIYRMESNPDATIQSQTFRDKYYWHIRSDMQEPRMIQLPSRSYHLAAVALVLQALPLSKGYQVVFPAGAYWIMADVSEAESIEINSQLNEVWKVKTTWIDRGNPQTVFPGGDDGSGGSYYMFKSPPKGTSPMIRNVWTDEQGYNAITMKFD